MQTLAHFTEGGPGPWILFFPLIWAVVIGGAVVLLRRTARRGRRGPWGPWGPAAPGADGSPFAVLGRRFASGEIDEDEFGRRLAVLKEHFGPESGAA